MSFANKKSFNKTKWKFKERSKNGSSEKPPRKKDSEKKLRRRQISN